MLTSAREIVETKGLGASEIAGVCGLSPFIKPWEIWARKRGLIVPEAPSRRMRRGIRLQQPAAQIFSEDYGIPHEWWDRSNYNPDRPWQRSTVDAFVPNIANKKAVLEVKTTGLDQAGEFARLEEGEIGTEDGIPDYYLAQVQWQLSTHDLKYGYLAVLIAGDELRAYKIERDQTLIDDLLEEGDVFWRRYVLGGLEPPPGHSDAVQAYIKRRWPREREGVRLATDAEMDLLNEYAEVRVQLEPLENRKKDLEVLLKKAAGDNAGIESPAARFTYKKIRDQQQVNWQKLAESQIESYPDDVRHSMIAEHTETIVGYRKIHFTDLRREAA